MTALGLLCEIMAAGGKPAASDYCARPGYAALLRHGFLQEVGVVSSVVCDECDAAHSAPVVFEDGRYGYHCPDLGFVGLDHASIQALRPDAGRLIGALAETFGCKRRKQTAIHGQTWRIGALAVEAGAVMVYLHAKLQSAEDARYFSDALSREVRAQWRLVVTAAGTMPVAGAQAVLLDELAELEDETGALHILAAPADLLGMPRKNLGGRPSEQGPTLAAIMLDRQESGVALAGLNAESREVRAAFKVQKPKAKTPSIETVKRHLSKFRAGS